MNEFLRRVVCIWGRVKLCLLGLSCMVSYVYGVKPSFVNFDILTLLTLLASECLDVKNYK